LANEEFVEPLAFYDDDDEGNVDNFEYVDDEDDSEVQTPIDPMDQAGDENEDEESIDAAELGACMAMRGTWNILFTFS